MIDGLSPAPNRVTPLGEIVAVAGRGAWTGNRGVLHPPDGRREIVRGYAHQAWIICALSFQGRWRPQWEPRRYTQLFFLDEAVALAAGHRPCAECRRGAFNDFRSAWASGQGVGRPTAKEMNAVLHGERSPREIPRRELHDQPWGLLPDGVFVRTELGPAVVIGDDLAVWDRADNAYRQRLRRPRAGAAAVITPASIVTVLRAGYPVQIDDAARGSQL